MLLGSPLMAAVGFILERVELALQRSITLRHRGSWINGDPGEEQSLL